MVTQFSEEMFRDDSSSSNLSPQKKASDPRKAANFSQQQAEKLRDEIRELQHLRQAQENEMAAIDNAALRNRFQAELDKLILQEQDKKEQVFDHYNFELFSFKNILIFHTVNQLVRSYSSSNYPMLWCCEGLNCFNTLCFIF